MNEVIIDENTFRQFLKNKGFIVNEKHENDNCIDIVAIKEGKYFLIEVKNVTKDNNSSRARHDLINNNCDFAIIISSTGWIYTKEIEGKPYSKIVRFFELL